MTRKKNTPKERATPETIPGEIIPAPLEEKAKRPRISKGDLSKFVDNASKSDDLEINEAVGIIEGLLALLQSAKKKDPTYTNEGGPMPPFKDCEERHAQLEELASARGMRNTMKWVWSVGLGTLIGVLGFFFKYYSNPLTPIKDQLTIQQEILMENRKILHLMGQKEGWEIDPNGKGYKTPWEVKLHGNSGNNGSNTTPTPKPIPPSNSTP